MTDFYNAAKTDRFALIGQAFGASAVSRTFIGPPGKMGLVRDIIVDVTAAMVGTTSVPEIRVGSSSTDSSFARFLLGTTATAGYGTGAFRALALTAKAQGRIGSKAKQLNDFAHHIALEGNDGSNSPSVAADVNGFAYLPADTAFFINGIAGVGGTPAGTADVYVDIDWF